MGPVTGVHFPTPPLPSGDSRDSPRAQPHFPHPMRWCHVVVGLRTSAKVLQAQAMHGFPLQQSLNKGF